MLFFFWIPVVSRRRFYETQGQTNARLLTYRMGGFRIAIAIFELLLARYIRDYYKQQQRHHE